MSKPVVRFTGEAHFSTYDGITDAIVFGVLDHPKLGKCRLVQTTEVIKYWPHDRSFETLNTVYEPVDPSELSIEDVV